MKISLPALLSLNGGYLDTAGFLALRGLFTAHVTGNFVTIGASLVSASHDATPKLLALPVFCAVVVITRLVARALEARGVDVLRAMLSLKVALLALGAALAIAHGPFRQSDAALIGTGMVLVAAMAIQNAAHRIHFASAPPTTLMTGTTTQIMIDLADLVRGIEPERRSAVRARLSAMAANVLAFAVGCAAAAVLYDRAGMWCFAAPPVIAAATPFMRPPSPPSTPR